MKNLTITQIEIYKSKIKLKEPFVISLGLLESAENIIVIIRTNQNIIGFGECSPFMTINGESIDTCFIVGQYLAKSLIGKDPLKIESCSLLMDEIIFGNSSIKSAFSIALFDIASQKAELPLFVFLGGINNKTLLTDYTVSINEPEKMANDALKIKQLGFTVIKIKLGESKDKDIQRIQCIREKIGNILPIRIDANQGWDTETAISILNILAEYNIQFCEEPIPRWNFMDLPKIRKQSPIPIMADESCCDHNDARRLIDLDACDYLNVKLGKSSGIFNAQKIIKISEQAGIKIQIGGFLESRLGFTASAHLALTNDYIVHCDFDTPMMFVEDNVVDGIKYERKGVVIIPDKIGLGATVDKEYLDTLEYIIVK